MRRMRLRFHLGALIVGTLLPVLAFSAWLIVNQHRHTRHAIQEELIEDASVVSLAVDREVETSISVLQALAASEHLRSRDLKSFDQFARAVMAMRPDWENVILYEASGQQLINLRLPFGAPLPAAGDPETLETVVRTRTPQVSNLFTSRVANRHIINVYVPVVLHGALQHALAAALSPSQMTAVFRQRALIDGVVASAASLIDRNGIIIAHSGRAEEFVGQAATADFSVGSLEMVVKDKGSLQAGTKDGTPVYAAFSRSPLTGWTLTLRVATATVDAPLRRSLSLLAGLAALVTALGVVLAAGAARQIRRPIVALSKAAPQIVSGDEPVAIPRSSVTEVDEVGRAIAAAHRERQRIEEQNRRLSEETERRRQSTESLAEVGSLISRSLDRERVAQAIVTSVQRLLDAKAAGLYRVDRDSQDLVLMADVGDGAGLPSRLPGSTSMLALAIRERRPATTPDVLNDPRVELSKEVRAVIEARAYRAVLAAPLLIRDEVVGALGIGALPGRVFSDEDVRLAQQFCDQAAIALEHATLYEAAQRRLSHTDTLLAVTQAVASTVDLGEVVRRTTRAMVRALGAEFGWAWRLTVDGDGVLPLAGYKIGEGLRQRVLALAGTHGHLLAEATKNLIGVVWSNASSQDAEAGNLPWLDLLPAHQSIIIVPLRLKKATIGGFILGWTQCSHPLNAEERDLLDGIAQAASVAIGNANLVDSATQHRARLEALLETSRALSRIQPLESLLKQIARACAQLLDSPSVGIRLVERDELVLRATVGDARAIMLTPRLKIGAGLTGQVIETGDSLMVINPADDPRHIASHRAADGQFGYRCWLGVPIKNGPRTLGLVVVRTRRESGFSDEDQSIATAFAAQAATAIENARLYQEIQSAYQELGSTKDQLTQSQKMEAVGRLAGGVAHDFNNLLTIIIGRLHLLRYGLKAGDPLYGEVELIEKAAFRAAALTRQLLAFSRKQVLQLKVLDLNAVVNEVAPMLRRVIGEDVELNVAPGSDLARVMADQGQLEQVLMNLAVNARDAMPSGGRLTIQTANVQLDAVFAAEHPGAACGPHVMVAVTDTGTGMSPEIRAQIFEPFFTTKEVGKGTGLGLSTAYGIVKQHQGYISVESTVGVGTVFCVYLPSAEQPAELLESGIAPSRLTNGRETILLVEDEPGVRQVAMKILQSNGYVVLEAEDVEDALRIADPPGTVIDLLLTDVVMPRLGGRDLADRVRRKHPEARVVFMSGYTDVAIAQHGLVSPGTVFLQKPFTPESLALKVREVLDRHRHANGDELTSSAVLTTG